MGKFIKLLFGMTMLLGLLLGVVVLGAVLYFDPNDHKDRIIAKVEEETGRKFKLEGDIKLSYYPWLGLEVEGVTLGNAEGFGDAPFFHADAVALRIKTMPLLKKQYELDTLRLHGVEVNLTKNHEGVSNWDDLVAEKDADAKKQEPTQLAAVILGGVDIKDAHFIWADQASGQTFRISDLNMSIGELRFGEPIDIKMNLKAESSQPAIKTDLRMQGTVSYNLDAETYAFNPIEVTAKLTGKNVPSGKADLKFNTGVVLNLKEETASVNELTLSVLGMLAKAQLNASSIKSERPKVEGDVSIVGEDLARLFKVAGVEPLASQLARLKDRSFDLQARLDADLERGNVAISDLKAKLIGASITGWVEASKVESDKPALRGRLQASGPDLPTLLQIVGQFEGGEEPKLRGYGEKLSKVSNKSFDVNAEFDADLASGNINVPALSVKTLGISVDGHLQANNINSKEGTIDGKLLIYGEKLSDIFAVIEQDALARTLSKVSISIGVNGTRSDIKLTPLEVQATFSGKQIPGSPVNLTLSADTRMNLDKQTLVVKKLLLNGLGLNVKGNINVQQIKENPTYFGDLAITEFNLRQFMKQMKQKIPATADEKVLRKIALQTKFSGSTNSLNIKDLSLLLDDTKLKGNISVEHFTQPTINFSIEIDNINADRYLPSPPKVKAGKMVKQEKVYEAVSAAIKLPVETLRKLNGKGELQIGKLIYSSVHLSNIKLGVNAKDGIIKLDPIAADLYQGKYKGVITFDAKGKLPQLKLETQLSGVQIEPLIKDFTQSPESQLAGVANIIAKVSSKGADAIQLKRGLNGQVKLAVTEGILRGIDVRRTLEQAEVLLESKRLGTIQQGGETRFEQLTGTLNIKNGLVKNNDLLITASGFKVNGGVNKKDTLGNLRKNSIRYDLSIAVIEERTIRGEVNYNIGGYEIPIRCRGSLDDLASACKPDYERLLGVAVKKALLDKLGESIGIKLPGQNQSTTESGTSTGSGTTTDKDSSQQERTQQPKSEPKSIEDVLENVLRESLQDLLPF